MTFSLLSLSGNTYHDAMNIIGVAGGPSPSLISTVNLLGTAAFSNIGTLAGNVVALDSNGSLPAVSGANLTTLNASSIVIGQIPSSAQIPNLPASIITSGTMLLSVLPLSSTAGVTFLAGVVGGTTANHFAIFDANGNITDGGTGGLGTAAYMAASNNSPDTTLSAITGAVSPNHIAQFADSFGSIKDGGVLGTAASKNSTNVSFASVAAVNPAGLTAGHFASFAADGSIQDGGAIGTASHAGATNVGNSFVVSTPSASSTIGNIPVYSDTTGSIHDGGTLSSLLSGILGQAAYKNVTNNSDTLVAMLSSFTNNSLVAFDNTGSLKPAGTFNTGSTGYIQLGAFILQWIIGPTDPANNTQPSHILNWGLTFPTACIVALASIDYGTDVTGNTPFYCTVGFDTINVLVQREGGSSTTTRAIVIGIGY